MKQKKSLLIIVVSVIAVCVLGFIASKVFNWPVNADQTSGNVAKSSRFSRKTAEEAASNMQELLLSDEGYKNGLVAAYLVMKTRAQQFGALVDMSEEVAGGIPEFKSVLKDMKAVRPMVENVCVSMDKAGEDLNAALGGETPKDLAQNTTNAALAYTTLQKQNSLATRFIDTADAYLAKAEADSRLKFVRDQWVEYQQLTAALENDEKAAEELEAKGHLLSADQTLAAAQTFNAAQQVSVVNSAVVSGYFGVTPEIVRASESVDYFQNSMTSETVQSATGVGNIQNSMTNETVQSATGVGNIQNSMTNETVQSATGVGNIQNSMTNETVQSATGVGNIQNSMTSETVQSATGVGNIQNAITTEVVCHSVAQGLPNLQSAVSTSVVSMSTNSSVVANTIVNTIQAAATGEVVSNAVKL